MGTMRESKVSRRLLSRGQELRSRPVMLCDGDTFYTADIVSKYREVAAAGCNGVFCFKDDQEKPIYSYITVPNRTTGVITDIREKVVTAPAAVASKPPPAAELLGPTARRNSPPPPCHSG